MLKLVLRTSTALILLIGTAIHAAAEERGAFLVTAEDLPEPLALYRQSFALVIGIDAYSNGWPRLSNAVRDAEVVAEELEGRGFEVTLATDLDSDALEETLEDFIYRNGRDPEARLLIWFAGHGHTIGTEGYLVPADAPAPDDWEFRRRALSLRDFGKFMRDVESKHVLAIFDSCFSGTVFATARARPPSAIRRATGFPVRQMISSGDADQTVSDDGTFRRLFIDALRGLEVTADANGDGYLTGSELGFFLTHKVATYSESRQTPRYGTLRAPGLDRGDFVFQIGQQKQLASLPPTPAAPETPRNREPLPGLPADLVTEEVTLVDGDGEPRLGVGFVAIPGEVSEQLGLTVPANLAVAGVPPDSAGQLGYGDILSRIDGIDVIGIEQLQALLTERNPGDTVSVDLVRLTAGPFEMDSWFRGMVDRSDSAAAAKFAAERFSLGMWVDVDERQAAEFYRIAADRGDAEAMVQVASYLFSVDRNAALVWYQKAADAGSGDAAAVVADYYVDTKSWEEAEHWALLATERGYQFSYLTLLNLYRRDESPLKDLRKSVESYVRYSFAGWRRDNNSASEVLNDLEILRVPPEWISELQSMLAELGVYRGDVNGEMDTATAEAVVAAAAFFSN